MIVESLEEELAKFKLSFSRISMVISDSATNMICMSKIIGKPPIRCLVHMLHTAVTKYLKLKSKKKKNTSTNDYISEEQDSEDSSSSAALSDSDYNSDSELTEDIKSTILHQ